MIKVGIIGAAGYTGGELIRILIHHPKVELAFAQSSSQSGKPIEEHHSGLSGELEMNFSSEHHFDIDVLFFCGGHGKSSEFFNKNNVPDEIKVIDLSSDFRLNGADGFIYGLPELNIKEIQSAKRIANPGCFATAIQLGLLPLAGSQLIKSEVHITAITGSTGAGAGLSPTSQFSWRNNNMSVYKAFEHQHLAEIKESLTSSQSGFDQELNFIPIRGNFTRGIFASIYLDFDQSLEAAQKIFDDYYSQSSFTFRVPRNPDLKQVVNTNKCLVYLEVHEGKLLIISMIDNLLKGASGQAVQNMNLMFELEETTGLNLKGTAF